MSIAQLLRQRARLRRAVHTVNAAGDPVRTWRIVDDGLPCAVELLAMTLESTKAGEVVRRRARLFLDVGDDASSDEIPDAGTDGRPRPGDVFDVEGIAWTVRAVRVERGARAAVRVVDAAVDDRPDGGDTPNNPTEDAVWTK